MSEAGALSVDAALAEARLRGVDRLDAHLLLGHLLGQPRTWLLAHGDATLAAEAVERFRASLARRIDGEPLAYLLGEKEFHGLLLQVDARVLVPRPDTEVLVDWAIELLGARRGTKPARVVDLGTGSGAVALAVKHARPDVDLLATDLSPAALDVARANAQRLGLAVAFAAGSWWEGVDGRRVDLALSNPPYIDGDDPHLDALRHEPRQALTPGVDGLASLRAIVAGAPARLSSGAWLLLEHGFEQAGAVADLLRRAGFDAVRTRTDIAGRPRCTGGSKR